MTDRREPPRCRPLPPSVVDGRAAPVAEAEREAALLRRLDEALHGLPADQRTAVIASYAYGEGPVGAAVELDVETADAADLGQLGLAALREALDGALEEGP